MKRFLSLLLGVVMLFSLVGCGGSDTDATKSNEVTKPKKVENYKDAVSAFSSDATIDTSDIERIYIGDVPITINYTQYNRFGTLGDLLDYDLYNDDGVHNHLNKDSTSGFFTTDDATSICRYYYAGCEYNNNEITVKRNGYNYHITSKGDSVPFRDCSIASIEVRLEDNEYGCDALFYNGIYLGMPEEDLKLVLPDAEASITGDGTCYSYNYYGNLIDVTVDSESRIVSKIHCYYR